LFDSSQDLFAILQASLYLFRGRPERSVLIFDVAANGVAVVANQLQDFFDGSVSLAERHVPAVISLPVANMNVHDTVMMFANKINRVVVARSKVADV